MVDSTSEGQDLLQILEDKIIKWQLDRSENKIQHKMHMDELLERVKKIKETNCIPCE